MDCPFLVPPGKFAPKTAAVYRCSFHGEEIDRVKDCGLGAVVACLLVSACPPVRNKRIDTPPLVCAVFQKE